jgi:hypothetical protein
MFLAAFSKAADAAEVVAPSPLAEEGTTIQRILMG